MNSGFDTQKLCEFLTGIDIIGEYNMKPSPYEIVKGKGNRYDVALQGKGKKVNIILIDKADGMAYKTRGRFVGNKLEMDWYEDAVIDVDSLLKSR